MPSPWLRGPVQQEPVQPERLAATSEETLIRNANKQDPWEQLLCYQGATRMTGRMEDDQHKQWVCALHNEVRQVYDETKLGLARPAIYLHESEQVWGRWDPLNLSISISRPVVQTCCWRVVVEILKHELAHQITDHLYGQDTASPGGSHNDPKQGPHGENFQRVCLWLRIEPWARRASSGKSLEELQELADWKCSPVDEQTARYQRRFEKLLALANSSNEHEAVLAMRRAQELQDQHRLARLDRDERGQEGPGQDELGNFVSLEIGSGKQRHAAYEGRIASILMSHFHVDIVFASRFDATACRPEAIIDILGRREDVLLAEYVHSFLHQSAKSLWQKQQRERGSKGLRARNSYIRGLLAGFDSKLTDEKGEPEEHGEPAPRTSKALVTADKKERARFTRQRYPRLSSRRSSARIDRGAYREGQSEGGKLSLRRPVSSGGTRSRARLLPGRSMLRTS